MGSDVNIQAMVVELSISIHAPAWGATSMQEAMGLHKWIFQSTLPAWGATPQEAQNAFPANISIHAPAWGATTLLICQVRTNVQHFNPRPRMGSDYVAPVIALSVSYFNPRPRMGSDHSICASVGGQSPFQSTPPHGERLSFPWKFSSGSAFQSTPPHGERHSSFLHLRHLW